MKKTRIFYWLAYALTILGLIFYAMYVISDVKLLTESGLTGYAIWDVIFFLLFGGAMVIMVFALIKGNSYKTFRELTFVLFVIAFNSIFYIIQILIQNASFFTSSSVGIVSLVSSILLGVLPFLAYYGLRKQFLDRYSSPLIFVLSMAGIALVYFGTGIFYLVNYMSYITDFFYFGYYFAEYLGLGFFSLGIIFVQRYFFADQN